MVANAIPFALPSLEAQFLLEPVGGTVIDLTLITKGHGTPCKDILLSVYFSCQTRLFSTDLQRRHFIASSMLVFPCSLR